MKSRRARVALHGFDEHPWQSVDRTRRFYLRALEPHFDLVFTKDGERTPPDADAVLSFSGTAGWQSLTQDAVPYLFAVHGGATLDHAALRENAARLRTFDTFIVNCASDETILAAMFDGEEPRFCRLPLPASESCHDELDQGDARAALPFETPPDLVVGFVARLLPQKNLHLFLRLFASLKARLLPRRVQAVVVGEYWSDYPVLPYVTREYRDYVATLAAHLGVARDVVYLGGKLDDAELRLVYGALDVLVHPTWSIDENFGYVPVEAMACGVPVVGAGYGGLKDTVVDGETGHLMPCWTTASGIRMDFISGLEHATRLLENDERRAHVSSTARARALAVYDHERCASVLVDAVRTSVRARDHARVPLVARPPEPARSPAGYLPELDVGWEYYWPSVDAYAGPRPEVDEGTRLTLFAPVRLSPGVAEFLDPAWPARIPVTEEEARICAACDANVVTAAQLDAHLNVLRGLVAKGALVASEATS